MVPSPEPEVEQPAILLPRESTEKDKIGSRQQSGEHTSTSSQPRNVAKHSAQPLISPGGMIQRTHTFLHAQLSAPATTTLPGGSGGLDASVTRPNLTLPSSITSPSSSEVAVNWSRRMKHVEELSSKRSSHMTKGIGRAHSFSAATIAAANQAQKESSQTPMSCKNATTSNNMSVTPVNPSHPRPHHRSMSNIVDWTPYHKSKAKPTPITAPFSPTHQIDTNKPNNINTAAAQNSNQPQTGQTVYTDRRSNGGLDNKRMIPSQSGHHPRTFSSLASYYYTRSLQFRDRLRASYTARRLRYYSHHSFYLIISVILTFIGLYAFDFNIAFLPKSFDSATSILLCIILSLFSLEILILSIIKPYYFLSFLMILDVIGTASLCLDISFMVPIDVLSEHDGSIDQQFTQSQNILRITRFARLLRVVRVVKLVRVSKQWDIVRGGCGCIGRLLGLNSTTATYPLNSPSHHTGSSSRHHHHTRSTKTKTANKVGMQLSELIDKRVIIMLLGILIILPFFTADNTNYGVSEQMGLQMLENTWNNMNVTNPWAPAGLPAGSTSLIDLTNYTSGSSNSTTIGNYTAYDFINQFNNYLSYQPNLIYLAITNNATQPSTTLIFYDQRSQHSATRSSEIDTFTTSPLNSEALFDVSSQYYWSSVYTILLITIIIAIFLLSTVIIAKDVYLLVVAPLERMTNIIKKLAGTICFLSTEESEITGDTDSILTTTGGGSYNSNAGNTMDFDAGHLHDQNSPLTIANTDTETKVIEDIIEKLALIFQVEPDNHAMKNGAAKALAMMAGTKHTEITTHTSVVSIEVVERPRDFIVDDETEMQTTRSQGESSGAGGGSAANSPPNSPKAKHNTTTTTPASAATTDFALYPELVNIETGLCQRDVLSHFRLYMTSNLLLENLLFYQEVIRFQYILACHANSLYSNFISHKSSTQVNISASLHDQIKANRHRPSASMFDAAQNEVIQLMKAHVRGFLDSRFAQMYARNKGRNGGKMGDTMLYKKKRVINNTVQVPALGELPSARSKRGSVLKAASNRAGEGGGGADTARGAGVGASAATSLDGGEEHSTSSGSGKKGQSTLPLKLFATNSGRNSVTNNGLGSDRPRGSSTSTATPRLVISLPTTQTPHGATPAETNTPRAKETSPTMNLLNKQKLKIVASPSSRSQTSSSSISVISPVTGVTVPQTMGGVTTPLAPSSHSTATPNVGATLSPSALANKRKSGVFPGQLSPAGSQPIPRVSLLSPAELEQEISALTHPGAEIDALVNPTKNKASVILKTPGGLHILHNKPTSEDAPGANAPTSTPLSHSPSPSISKEEENAVDAEVEEEVARLLNSPSTIPDRTSSGSTI